MKDSQRRGAGCFYPAGTNEASPLNSLTKEQLDLMRSAWTSPPPLPDHSYPGDRANRWIFMRALSLGWSPKLFGERDRFIRHGGISRSEHKAERWGKKYQWVAYHELLARVADNYQSRIGNWDSETYDGLHQITGGREIDPSLPPVRYSEFVERTEAGARTWGTPPVAVPASVFPKLTFARYHGDVTLLLRDQKSRPLPETSSTYFDDTGGEWIALDSFEVQSERPGEWETARLDQTTILHAFFVHREDAKRDAQRLAAIWKDTGHELDPHGHVDCCYAGEVAWSPRSCPYRLGDWRTVGKDGETVEVVDATEDYSWEGNILDCSIEETVTAKMPSRFVLQQAGLAMSTNGPSWTDSSGTVVAVFHDAPKDHEEHANTLYPRTNWLRRFLNDLGLAVAIVCRYERRLTDSHSTYRHPYETTWCAAVYDADGKLTKAGPPLTQLGPDPEDDDGIDV